MALLYYAAVVCSLVASLTAINRGYPPYEARIIDSTLQRYTDFLNPQHFYLKKLNLGLDRPFFLPLQADKLNVE